MDDRTQTAGEGTQSVANGGGPHLAEPIYGYMNRFLNTDRKRWPSAPATAFAHSCNGTNLVYVDPEHDLVAVVRWIDGEAIDGFLKRLTDTKHAEETSMPATKVNAFFILFFPATCCLPHAKTGTGAIVVLAVMEYETALPRLSRLIRSGRRCDAL